MFEWLHLSGLSLFLLMSPFIVIAFLLFVIVGFLARLTRQQKLIIQQQQELIGLTVKAQVQRRTL
ncbi:hypothetical protein ERX27_05890 [Macrococcus brunensis]|uniref:Uncharacterized protein n=1 Tax=Macrococcus brunensis TaxID=198483 RepID=A0A4R6BDW4_9STAP|nr:hypothetical protein [Macrococcus brunensis]TDL97991.1 hypothetical protein ERX27_05890 [Macrococcus brunensis]ULG74008.1 hypothetical protein MGG13_10225 [Macrococcus brunensis]